MSKIRVGAFARHGASQVFRRLVCGLGMALTISVAAPASAQHTTFGADEASFRSCVSQLDSNSLAIDATAPRMPLSFASDISFKVPSHAQGAAGVSSCGDFTWVKVPTNLSLFFKFGFSARISWAGRTTTSAWDCNHSTLAWGVYKRALTGGWTYVGGGDSYGNMPGGNGGQCLYDMQGFPGGHGTFNINDPNGSSGAEYRIAFFTWSHNDPALGHPGTDCATLSCNWPAAFNLTGVRPPAVEDYTVWRPSNGTWYVLDSADSSTSFTQQWGVSGDVPVPGDYDSDTLPDYAVWRPSNGTWYIIDSSTGVGRGVQYGDSTYTPVPADYSGDGKTDLALRKGGSWLYVDSRNGNFHQSILWGVSQGVPVPANYDGDLSDDIGVFQPSGTDGKWFIFPSSGPSTQTIWGVPTDIPVPGDYDGDRKADIAVWRPSSGVWYVINSSSGGGWWVQWGVSTDIPRPVHLDSDKKLDVTVYRPSEGRWYSILSSTGAQRFTYWGVNGDVPLRFFR